MALCWQDFSLHKLLTELVKTVLLTEMDEGGQTQLHVSSKPNVLLGKWVKYHGIEYHTGLVICGEGALDFPILPNQNYCCQR